MTDTRRAGTRAVAALIGALAVTAGLAPPASGATASPSAGAGSPPAPTTTLPPIPQVPASITSGRPAGTLLSSALSLSSVGVDDTALLAALDTTEARLESDGSRAAQAVRAARAAGQAAAEAAAAATRADAAYRSMRSAIRQAAVDLYIDGTQPMAVSPRAGALALYAGDYEESALTPYGVLAAARRTAAARSSDLSRAVEEQRRASTSAALAEKALADERAQEARLRSEVAALSTATATAVVADHQALADQAAAELASTRTALQFTPKAPLPAPVSTTSVALDWAFAELGRPYVWGATGPATFDCSGLTQFVWRAAGVDIPRVAADQYAWTVPVPLADLLPGDLVFFGTSDIHHVGIYIGDGLMINAPHTGDVVRVSSIWWSDLAGFGRVHYPGTPVPPHGTPDPAQPAAVSVVTAAGPVPSQSKPPPGWIPGPGTSTPVALTPTGKQSQGPSGPTTTVATTTTTLPLAGEPPVPPSTEPVTTVPAPAAPIPNLPSPAGPLPAAPDTTVPATTVPATSVPATSVPATSVPATTVPETTTTSPNTTPSPDTTAPGAATP